MNFRPSIFLLLVLVCCTLAVAPKNNPKPVNKLYASPLNSLIRLLAPLRQLKNRPSLLADPTDFDDLDGDLHDSDKRDMEDDYGHMRFGKRGGEFDEYGHMRFGRANI